MVDTQFATDAPTWENDSLERRPDEALGSTAVHTQRKVCDLPRAVMIARRGQRCEVDAWPHRLARGSADNDAVQPGPRHLDRHTTYIVAAYLAGATR